MKTKKLTDSDLGLGSSHQTHIGLHSEMLKSWSSNDVKYDAFLFIDGKKEVINCEAVINAITRRNGSIEAPKIKVGEGIEDEKNLLKIIRKSAADNPSLRYLTFAELGSGKVLVFLTTIEPPSTNAIVEKFSEKITNPPKSERSEYSVGLIKKFGGKSLESFAEYITKKGYEID